MLCIDESDHKSQHKQDRINDISLKIALWNPSIKKVRILPVVKFINRILLLVVNNTHSDGSNHCVSRWTDKVTQDYDRNKVEHSQTAVSNVSYIIGEMFGEKRV